jgi:hypothetical protein
VIEGDFDVASGRLRFTQAYIDGAETHWEARLVGYPHGPQQAAPSPPSKGARLTKSPKMLDGSWAGDCEGCFTATLLYTLTLADPLPEGEQLEQEPAIGGRTDSTRKALAVGHVDAARSTDLAQTERQTVADTERHGETQGDRSGRVSHSDVGTGRDAAEQAAAQALRAAQEQQQQSIKAEAAAERAGIVGASFDKLRAKFFRACVAEAQVHKHTQTQTQTHTHTHTRGRARAGGTGAPQYRVVPTHIPRPLSPPGTANAPPLALAAARGSAGKEAACTRQAQRGMACGHAGGRGGSTAASGCLPLRL